MKGDLFYYSTNPTGSSLDVTEMPIHGRLTYYANVHKNFGFIFGLGAVYNQWGGDSLETYYNTTTDNDAGPGGLVGLRFGGGPVSLRVDLTGDYIINPFNETSTDNDSRFDLGMDAMLSFAFGGNKTPEGFGQGRCAGQDAGPVRQHPGRDGGGRQRLPLGRRRQGWRDRQHRQVPEHADGGHGGRSRLPG